MMPGELDESTGTTAIQGDIANSVTTAESSKNACECLCSVFFKETVPTYPVSILMNASSRSSPVRASSKPKKSYDARNGLGAYLASPESYPSSVVLSFNESCVIINDLFPKSSVHILLLPYTPLTLEHPITAFEDKTLRDTIERELAPLKQLAASELQRKYGQFSAQEQARRVAMDAEPPPDNLPTGRDWAKEIMVGFHAGPSMHHLHLHIISRDRYSECMKHRKHYNSFATPFFIGLYELPLSEDDPRRKNDRGGWLKTDLICWRCKQNFGNQFQALKRHLEIEFDSWKRE